MNQNKDYVNIPIPSPIVERIKIHIKNTEFNSVAEYIVFILKEVVGNQEGTAMLTAEEEAQVKATLKKLGYLKDE